MGRPCIQVIESINWRPFSHYIFFISRVHAQPAPRPRVRTQIIYIIRRSWLKNVPLGFYRHNWLHAITSPKSFGCYRDFHRYRFLVYLCTKSLTSTLIIAHVNAYLGKTHNVHSEQSNFTKICVKGRNPSKCILG